VADLVGARVDAASGSADHVLTTTRAVRRRLDLDRPVADELLDECVRVAMQAPMGGNNPRLRFVIVTDPERRSAMAEIYRECFESYRHSGRFPTDERSSRLSRRQAQVRVAGSAEHLARVLDQVPALVMACAEGRPPPDTAQLPGYFGSVLPGVWSFMLAARARGLGTCWTTMHLPQEQRMADLLAIPHDRVAQVALIPTAHTRGEDFAPAQRPAVDAVRAWQSWTFG
jgi:nitroreductase